MILTTRLTLTCMVASQNLTAMINSYGDHYQDTSDPI